VKAAAEELFFFESCRRRARDGWGHGLTVETRQNRVLTLIMNYDGLGLLGS
jgi:hypothetical protein